MQVTSTDGQTSSTNDHSADMGSGTRYCPRMTDILEVLLLAVALVAAWLAGSRHAGRRAHPRYVHHSIAFVAVAIVAGLALLFYGPS
ncbi:MAG TPA: hypothetical protein VNR68_03105 [Sphingomicrobium sp.]|nr:hypothetical protein [Sphingomicrobium sp.]